MSAETLRNFGSVFRGHSSKAKVEATASLCRRINRHLEIDEVPNRFWRSMAVGNTIFCCVDQIELRRLIWGAVNGQVGFFTDGRMSAEVLRVLTVGDSAAREYYPTTLFSAEQAYQGSCTAKSTICCANIAAGLMLAQFTKWLRGIPIDMDLSLNLLASEIAVFFPHIS